MAGFDVGHGDCDLSIPIGLEATLDTEKQMIAFHEPVSDG